VQAILTCSSRLAAGLEKMQEGEAFCVSAEEEEASWLKRVSEVERKEGRLLDLRLEGNISTEQFHAKRAALQEAKEIAKTGLEASVLAGHASKTSSATRRPCSNIMLASFPKTSMGSPLNRGGPSTE
jgi:hypothetical protein